MTKQTYRRIFWAAIVGAFCGILAFSKTQSWAAVLTVGACGLVAFFAGEAGDIYAEEDKR